MLEHAVDRFVTSNFRGLRDIAHWSEPLELRKNELPVFQSTRTRIIRQNTRQLYTNFRRIDILHVVYIEY